MGDLKTKQDSYCLYDQKTEKQIEGNDINYKEVYPYVYLIGDMGDGDEITPDKVEENFDIFFNHETRESLALDYEINSQGNIEKMYYTKINYETGYIFQRTDLESFTNEDREVFKEISKENN